MTKSIGILINGVFHHYNDAFISYDQIMDIVYPYRDDSTDEEEKFEIHYTDDDYRIYKLEEDEHTTVFHKQPFTVNRIYSYGPKSKQHNPSCYCYACHKNKEKEENKKPTEIKILINGQSYIHGKMRVTYEEIFKIMFPHDPLNEVPYRTIMFRRPNEIIADKLESWMNVKIYPGMEFFHPI